MSYNTNPNRNNSGFYNPRYSNPSKKYRNNSNQAMSSESSYGNDSYGSNSSSNSRRNDGDYYGSYRPLNRYDSKYGKHSNINNSSNINNGGSVGSSYSSKGTYYPNTSNNNSSLNYKRRSNFGRYDSYTGRKGNASSLNNSSSNINRSLPSSNSSKFDEGKRFEIRSSNEFQDDRKYQERDDFKDERRSGVPKELGDERKSIPDGSGSRDEKKHEGIDLSNDRRSNSSSRINNQSSESVPSKPISSSINNSNSKNSSQQSSPSPVITNPKLLHLFDDDNDNNESEHNEDTTSIGKNDLVEIEKTIEKKDSDKQDQATETKKSVEDRIVKNEIEPSRKLNDNESKKWTEKPKTSFSDYLKTSKQRLTDESEENTIKNATYNEQPEALELNELYDSRKNSPVGNESEYVSPDVQKMESNNISEEESESFKSSEDQDWNISSNDQQIDSTNKISKQIQSAESLSKPSTPSKSYSEDSKEPASPLLNTQMVADSSTLSPVADSAPLNDPFFTNLTTINETKEGDKSYSPTSDKERNVDEDEESLSEAETIITNSPPRINKGRRLVRKKDYDEDRERLKRKVLESSDEDDYFDQNHSNDERKKLKQKPYKLKRDSSGRSLLQRACKKGNLLEIKNFIERGADVNECDFCGFTCLHEAALEGHTEVVKLLIEKGANVNVQAYEAGYLETPLIDAAENKHIDTVRVLLDSGANPNIYNIDGFTALTKIYNEHDDEEGYEEIITFLEEANNKFISSNNEYDKSIKSNSRAIQPLAPSSIVEDPNDNYFSDLIKRKGIYKYAAEGQKELTANYFVSGNTLDSKPDILILAARNGHTELVDIILGLNPGSYDIDHENGCGLTALLASVGRGHYEIVESLLSKGADPYKRRKQDRLNALEISQRSAHFDPKEVKLLQEYMEKTSSKEESDSEIDNNIDVDVDESFVSDSSVKSKIKNEKKRKATSDNESSVVKSKKLRRIKSESKSKQQPGNVFNKEKTPDFNESTKSRDQSYSPQPDKPKQRSNHTTVSPSPTPSSKAQEELKARSAEEARIWQEKVEAKKRARRDMFLKSEKEKERKRKEDEEKRAEDEKKLAFLKQQEELRLVKEAEEKLKKLHEQKEILQHELTIEHYPIGLKSAKFDTKLTTEEILQYSPLYLFELRNEIYVVDLQISLLAGSKISTINQKLGKNSIIEVDSFQKSKIWNIFFPMIGIDKSRPNHNLNQLFYQGHSKFQYLLINFIKFDEVSHLIKQDFSTTYEEIWQNNKFTKVNLDSLHPLNDSVNTLNNKKQIELMNDNEIAIDSKSIEKSNFIPPKFKYRKDIIRAIHSASTPLW